MIVVCLVSRRTSPTLTKFSRSWLKWPAWLVTRSIRYTYV